MTITIPAWPFTVLLWAVLTLCFVLIIAFTMNRLVHIFKNRKLWRLARIFLTCENWRDGSTQWTMRMMEDALRFLYADQPQSFAWMRARILDLGYQGRPDDDLIQESPAPQESTPSA